MKTSAATLTIHNPPHAPDAISADSVRFWNRWRGPELVDQSGKVVAVWNDEQRQWQRPPHWNDRHGKLKAFERIMNNASL